jgi:hypothetical protein
MLRGSPFKIGIAENPGHPLSEMPLNSGLPVSLERAELSAQGFGPPSGTAA